MNKTRYLAGQAPTTWTPGDVLLTRNNRTVGQIIRFGQRLHYHGDDRKYCWTNHAALVYSKDGLLIESLSHGPVVTESRHYKSRDYVVVGTGLSALGRAGAVQVAAGRVGNEYGYMDIVSIALSLITGKRIHLPHDKDSIICSALVAEAMAAGGLQIGPTSDIDWVMPADLAKFWGVTSGGSGI